jgi:hypothetical protein
VALFKPITTPDDLPPVGASRESGTFDFKESQDPGNKQELAKDVAAFANSLGGIVLVGAVEDRKRGTLGLYKPIPQLLDAEALKQAYELAVTQRCVPPPMIDVVRIETPASLPPGHLIAVNIYAAPRAPIGVRWNGAEAFAFPLRTATQTHWMTPTEIPMLMVPEIRRVALCLERIPLDQRSDVTIQHSNSAGSPMTQMANFRGVDPELTTATFTSAVGPPATSTIPLDRITSVWRKDETHWYIAVNGFLGGASQGMGFIYRPH